jgi:hypothetical protein
MLEGSEALKSPKTARRVKTTVTGDTARQVHFTSGTQASVASPGPSAAGARGKDGATKQSSSINTSSAPSSTSLPTTAAPETVDTQPTTFPQVGPPPGTHSFAAPGGQWHTSASSAGAAQSVNPILPAGQQLATPLCLVNTPFNLPQALPQGPCLVNTSSLLQPLAFVHQHAVLVQGQQQQHQQQQPQAVYPLPQATTTSTPAPAAFVMAADYQNAAPPISGANFQPPVPDTTYGPMSHVYVPRFDGGVAATLAPGAALVGLPLRPVVPVSAPVPPVTYSIIPSTVTATATPAIASVMLPAQAIAASLAPPKCCTYNYYASEPKSSRLALHSQPNVSFSFPSFGFLCYIFESLSASCALLFNLLTSERTNTRIS